jgi:IS30 family transposase
VVCVVESLTDEERERIAELIAAGASLRTIRREIPRSRHAVARAIRKLMRPPKREPVRCQLRLSPAEREEISRGLATGESMRQIATGLGRSASTVSREVAANGGRRRYRAHEADRRAVRNLRRPKTAKLAACPGLRGVVEEKLALRWSPQQISGWLVRTFPDDAEMRVSHETIYMSLFVQARGALNKELTRYLRTQRARRRPHGSPFRGEGMGQIKDPVNIRERPPEAEDRSVPGHWEGDLLFGKGKTAIVTLVERRSRFVMLIGLGGRHTADMVADALAAKIVELPDQLRRSITWDQGKEMAQHARFSSDSGVPVYFCDPRSPWQRGSNENTNGLLRQYLPRKTLMHTISQAQLDDIAAELNNRPRQTLDFMTPSEALDEALR